MIGRRPALPCSAEHLTATCSRPPVTRVRRINYTSWLIFVTEDFSPTMNSSPRSRGCSGPQPLQAWHRRPTESTVGRADKFESPEAEVIGPGIEDSFIDYHSRLRTDEAAFRK